jgi:YD repeat-containing protein
VVNGLGSFDVDPGDGISLFAWSFGDGPGVVYGAMPSHAYQAAGSYQVSLTVTDGQNATSTASTTASITAAPPVVPPSGTTPGNAAQFIAQSVPTSMTAGENYPVSVTMRNTGTTTWSGAHLYRLGSQSPQDNQTWGKARIHLPADVAPGATVTFNFTVVAPFGGAEESPPAQFQWRMVQDEVEWFGAATQNQDVQIISNYEPQFGDAPHPGQFSDLFASRIAPQHRTGQPGEDLLSGNYNWGLGMLDLAGRSGLNLNLSLNYNSLAAWTKVVPPSVPLMPPRFQRRTSWTFDADRGFPSAGFRMGFPSIQGPFNNNQTGDSSYLALLPSGIRVELRKVDSSNVYEAADSSYLQLLDGGNGSLLLRTTDGIQLSYWSINSEYRCTEVQDRNGNYLSIKYDPINGTANLGRMTSIIDTLGRTFSFNYDTNYRLQSITQLRNGQTHVWATFGYTAWTIETNFSNASSGDVLGLPSNHIVSVLTQVGLDDGSRYNFDYTTWGQVYKITRHAADSTPGSPHPLSYVSYNLPLNNSAAQTDCPRFTQRNDWAENWNNNQPVTTSYQINPDGPWSQVTTAEGTANEVRYKEFSTGDYYDWRRGLVTRTEIFTPNSTTPRKTTITDWTQDSTNVAYPLNPRSSAVTIFDAEGNRRRRATEYGAFGLASDVYEMGPYGANDWRTLGRTHTDYNLSDAYVSRRIIGLLAGQYLLGPDAPDSNSTQTLLAKITFEYDVNAICSGPCYSLVPEAPTDPVVHHALNYGASFQVGRGLLANVKRWDAFDEMNSNKATTSSMVYNVYGSLIRSVDPLLHATQIHYDDAFSNDGIGSNPAPYVTMAYPTSVRDPDGYYSSASYNYDLGAATRKQDSKGAAQTSDYDSAGRVKRITNTVNTAYTRFVYPLSQTIVNKFTTIQEGEGEVYSATVFDGAGRVRAVAGDFPNSIGNYSGQFALYDQLGRATQATNPTEMNHAWSAAGDDAVGWSSSSQTYDWKGRALVTTNPDGTMKEASYGGCGCAGGAVITLTDEGTMEGGILKRRQQKMYSDPLGRTIKTEVLNWQGGSVYSTTVTTYNARSQVTRVQQYAGPEGGTHQDMTMTYDGYGRLVSRHLPEQDASTSTTYAYYADDALMKVTDARGAASTVTYNGRHLPKTITYSAPSGIAPTAPVTFAYDSAGNRTSMIDGLGSVTYEYDTLSRMRSEARTFSDPSNSSINGVTKTISSDYNLAGELKSITDPSGATINYSHDALGRLDSVTGSTFGFVTNYISSAKYRAWGAPKHLAYGNSKTVDATYNARMQAATFNIPGVMSKTYDYNSNGQLRFSSDLLDHKLDRSYSYDHMARTTQALSGAEARGEAETNARPYKQTFSYDALGHLSARTSSIWNLPLPATSDSYVENRRSGWSYDADGNLLSMTGGTFSYDAAGNVKVAGTFDPVSSTTRGLDGDGQQLKTVEVTYHNESSTWVTTTKYYMHSTVLGGHVLTELASTGAKTRTFVYAGGNVLAWQQYTGTNEEVLWEHRDASNSSFRMTELGGGVWGGTDEAEAAELDPTGANTGTHAPFINDPPPEGGSLLVYPRFADPTHPEASYSVDGIPVPVEYFMSRLDSAFQSSFGVYEYLARMSGNNGLYGNKWVPNPPSSTPVPEGAPDGHWESSAIAVGPSWSWSMTLSGIVDRIKTDVEAAKGKVKGDQRCRDFLNDVLGRVHPDQPFFNDGKMTLSGVVPNDIFDALTTFSGASFEETKVSGVTAETINDLSTIVGSRHVMVNTSYSGQDRKARIFAVIHESLHMFSGFTDQALAESAQRVAGVKEKDLQYFSRDPEGVKKASLKLNDYIKRYCSDLEVTVGTTYKLGE